MSWPRQLPADQAGRNHKEVLAQKAMYKICAAREPLVVSGDESNPDIWHMLNV